MSSSSSLPGLLNPAHRIAWVFPPVTLSSSLVICRMGMGTGMGTGEWGEHGHCSTTVWKPQSDLMAKLLHLLQSLWTCPFVHAQYGATCCSIYWIETSVNWDVKEEANPALGGLYKPGVIVSTAASHGGLVGALGALVSVHVFALLQQLARALRQAAYSQHS